MSLPLRRNVGDLRAPPYVPGVAGRGPFAPFVVRVVVGLLGRAASLSRSRTTLRGPPALAADRHQLIITLIIWTANVICELHEGRTFPSSINRDPVRP